MEKVKRTVLIVDDERTVCEELQKYFRRNFFSTYVAYTGQKALKIAGERNIDVLLLDVRMPDIDGLELLKQFKAKLNCEAIIMTGHGSQEIAIQALRWGAIDYLEKPIDQQVLDAAVGRALEKLAEKEKLVYRISVLIVDDDRQFTQNLKKILQKEGYDVLTADDGLMGLEIASTNKIDVILTDIKMPGMDGIQLLEKAKNLYRDLEVIVITGYGEEELAVKSLRKGAISYLHKPISLEELCIEIERAVERISLYRNQLYRHRELKINTEIISKMNEELERRVTERTHELAQTQAQLFQTSKLATLGEMSAGLAHELNQPLTGISLITVNTRRLMEKGLLTGEEMKEAMLDIEQNVRRMSNVITHIRTFARQDTFKPCQMNVNESIENALGLLGEQLRLREIEVTRELASDLPNIIGEPYQIEQVAINLLTNARDALEEKGKWEPEKLKDWSKKLKIKTALKGGCVCLEVSDNGIGMSYETRQKIFDPFFTTKEVGRATGLGLSISHGIVQNHKGKMNVKSDLGKGTTVSVKFPLRMGKGHEK